MHTLSMVVRGVISEIARQEIEQGVGVVVRSLKLIIGVQTTVVVVGDPDRKQQADEHW